MLLGYYVTRIPPVLVVRYTITNFTIVMGLGMRYDNDSWLGAKAKQDQCSEYGLCLL